MSREVETSKWMNPKMMMVAAFFLIVILLNEMKRVSVYGANARDKGRRNAVPLDPFVMAYDFCFMFASFF